MRDALRRSLFGLALAAALGACAPSRVVLPPPLPAPPAAAPQAPPPVRPTPAAPEAISRDRAALLAIRGDSDRVGRVAWRLMAANAELCPADAAPMIGAEFWTLETFPPRLQAAAAAAYGVGDGVSLAFVAPGSPAERAGLRAGDRIAAIEGEPVDGGGPGLGAFYARLQAALRRGGAEMTVERDGRLREARVAPVLACRYATGVDPSMDVNAYADGRNVRVTRGLLAFAPTDRDLAIVVGHEMAHNALGHIAIAREAASRGPTLGEALDAATGGRPRPAPAQPFSVGFEMEADYVGLYLMRRAGYDIEGAPNIWSRLAEAFPDTLWRTATHPAAGERYAAMQAAVREIQAKERRGEPLRPGP